MRVTTNTFLETALQGKTTTVTDYNIAVTGIGAAYFIGRPSEVNSTTTQYVNTLNGTADVKTAKQKYTYNNGLVIKTERNANNDPVTMLEEFDYFTNGLLKTKKVSAIGTTTANAVSDRLVSYSYDPTNRFVKTTIDSENLTTTNLTFHAVYGATLSQQNPFGQTTTTILDNWGKPTKITDFLGKSITIEYFRNYNIFTTTNIGDDGAASLEVKDALLHTIKKGAKNINGFWVYVNTEYEPLGKKIKDSEPYFENNNPTQWSVFEYDEYNRPTKTTSHTGKIITTTYNGLSVKAADSVMLKTKIMNALGQVVVATDEPGGTILYKFDASGNMLQSDYDGIKIDVSYDNWGRKTELKDSSAGTYTYSYNAYGETKVETTPKGITEYTLDSLGKVLTKKVTGDGTDIISNYNYDATNKWLNSIVVTNNNDGNNTYVYSYDPTTRQLNKTVETLFQAGNNSPIATFTKQISFDSFGRLQNETSTAAAFGKSSTKTITHTYKNGAPWQILDGTTIKWQTNNIDARGQLLTATMGNGIAITNKYDIFGYNIEAKHALGTNNIMLLQNSFDPILANLSRRYNNMFNKTENFKYDTQDRLVEWDATQQDILNCTFTNTTEGFTVVNTGGWGIVSVANNKLKVQTSGLESGTQKLITETATVGDKFRIKVEIAKTAGNSIMNARVIETDPTTQETYITELGVATNNILESEFEVISYPNLMLQFYIVLDPNSGNNGLDPGDGSGQTLVTGNFTIDNLVISPIKVYKQQYDNRGRITENNVGTYNYNVPNKPYQNSSILTTLEATDYYEAKPLQNITYNCFKAPIEISVTGSDKISFGYNAMQQRSVMYYGSENTDKLLRPYRKYFSADGSMEIKATFDANSSTTPIAVEFVTYIGGDAYTSPMIVKSDGTTQNYFYFHRDYQGSLLAITNDVGSVTEKRIFDPWGSIVHVADGAGNILDKLTFIDRGYTGHQHLESVGLVHMNGRLYDPKLHRFLQPDNFVQDPHNTQSFNRYGYCWNNPLKYTDRNGEELVSAILIGAGVALAAYLTTSIISGTPITLKGALIATFIGAVSGAVTCGIGTWTKSITVFAEKAIVQAVAHGIFQGIVSGVQGGGFWAGAAAGAVSSIASSLYTGGGNWNGFAGKAGATTAGILTFGAIGGGTAAALAKGNFWQGALTGLIVSGLNHAMHYEFDPKPKVNYKKFFAEALRNMLQNYKTDIAAAAITGQYRHVFGPDALYVSGTGSVSPIGPAVSASFGKLIILYGANAGLEQRVGVCAKGVIWRPGASATFDFTKIYYSGTTTEFNKIGFDAFYGWGIEATGSAGVSGGTLSLNFSWAPTSDKHFTIGVGISAGAGTPGFGGGILKTDTKWF